MKTKILFITGILLLHFSVKSQAQFIQSLTVIPANPTTADTITILAECYFPSAGCDEHTQFVFVNGQDIYASALHCLGPMTVICPYTDTIILNPLPAGNYTFHFQLDGGFGPSPCTPGIVTGPTDSISFVVSPASGINEFISQDAVSVFPNPCTNEFQLVGVEPESYPLQLEIFSPEGKLVKRAEIPHANTSINVGELPAAVYQVRVRKNNGELIIILSLKK
jgi:Secretion system C-terminal sorting domain